MADRLRVKTRGFTYPADADSLAMVRAAGGVSKLTPAERAAVRFKSVAPGDFCDDMPADSAAIFLERGDVERVPVTPPAPSRGADGGAA